MLGPMRSESYKEVNNSMSTWRSLGLDSESELKYIKNNNNTEIPDPNNNINLSGNFRG